MDHEHTYTLSRFNINNINFITKYHYNAIAILISTEFHHLFHTNQEGFHVNNYLFTVIFTLQFG